MISLYNILTEKTFKYTDLTVRSMAWLYLIAIPYKGKLNYDKWTNSKRMGIYIEDAIKYLKKKNYITFDGKIIKTRNLNYITSILNNFFKVNINNSLNYYLNFTFFKKYDTSNYTISNISFDLYDRMEKQTDSILANDNTTETDIKNWYTKKYQNNQSLNLPTKFYKKTGLHGLVNKNKTYTLFRGIYVDKDKYPDLIQNKNILFNDNRISWTLSLNTAKKFAFGNSVYFDNKQIADNKLGIVLTTKFNMNDILLDVNYVANNNDYFGGELKFNNEYEVIVKPKKRKAKIFKIYPSGTKV
jgi:hypothetical protein